MYWWKHPVRVQDPVSLLRTRQAQALLVRRRAVSLVLRQRRCSTAVLYLPNTHRAYSVMRSKGQLLHLGFQLPKEDMMQKAIGIVLGSAGQMYRCENSVH